MNEGAVLLHGDCLELLRTLDDCSVVVAVPFISDQIVLLTLTLLLSALPHYPLICGTSAEEKYNDNIVKGTFQVILENDHGENFDRFGRAKKYYFVGKMDWRSIMTIDITAAARQNKKRPGTRGELPGLKPEDGYGCTIRSIPKNRWMHNAKPAFLRPFSYFFLRIKNGRTTRPAQASRRNCRARSRHRPAHLHVL